MHRVPCSLAALSVLALAAPASTPLVVPLAAQTTPEGFKVEIERQFGASARKVIMLAETMPAEKYGWSPEKGIASVARVLPAHCALQLHVFGGAHGHRLADR